jgi:hypothetical protein
VIAGSFGGKGSNGGCFTHPKCFKSDLGSVNGGPTREKARRGQPSKPGGRSSDDCGFQREASGGQKAQALSAGW